MTVLGRDSRIGLGQPLSLEPLPCEPISRLRLRFLEIFMFKKLLQLRLIALLLVAPPDQVIQNTTEQMRTLIRQNSQTYKTDKTKFYSTVDEVLVPHFDVKYVAQLILGRNWRTASEDQRTHFQNAFKNMLVRGYADELLENNDSVKVEYRPVKLTDGQTDATVSTLLQRAQVAQPTHIDFQVRLIDGDWKIYDVTIENISLVTNYRTQVGAEIKRTSLDDVIERMEKGQLLQAEIPKTASASSGSSK